MLDALKMCNADKENFNYWSLSIRKKICKILGAKSREECMGRFLINSVCHSRSIAPFGFALDRKTWPSLVKSVDTDFGLAYEFILAHESFADFPVMMSFMISWLIIGANSVTNERVKQNISFYYWFSQSNQTNCKIKSNTRYF